MRPWIGQALIFWAGLVVLLLAVVSPVDYWSDTYLSAHVVQHILLAFVAPPLIVLGAPWVPLLARLPQPVARGYGRVVALHAGPPHRLDPSPGLARGGRVRALQLRP